MTSAVPPLSICLVTPVRNGAAHLAECLQSIHGQNYPALDHVVVDGGSTDGTQDILRAHEGRLRWTSGPDGGMYDALNKGFAQAEGEIMGYLNADDRLQPGALHVVAEIFQTRPEIDWITSLYPTVIDGRGRIVRCRERKGFSSASFRKGAYLPAPERPGAFWIQQESTFWRRSLWQRVGAGFDSGLRMAGDFELWSRFFQHAELYGVAAPLGCFRRHAGQLTEAAGAKIYAQEASGVLARLGLSPLKGRRWQAYRLSQRLARGWTGPVVVFDAATGIWRIEGRRSV